MEWKRMFARARTRLQEPQAAQSHSEFAAGKADDTRSEPGPRPRCSGAKARDSRPGGNATGVPFLLDELASKCLEFFKEAAPAISRIVSVHNPDHVDNELREAERTALKLGLQLEPLPMQTPADFTWTTQCRLVSPPEGERQAYWPEPRLLLGLRHSSYAWR
jgi:hypothetical protein